MIGKAKAISHGINNLSYIMGESKNKKHPEKIDVICTQFLPKGLDAMGVWESMQATTAGMNRLKNNLIQIELSPPKEYTQTFTAEDWEQLWKDFTYEFDRQTIKDKKGKITSRPTNIAGSKAIVCKHEESKGGIVHLHGAVCRVDEDGNVNNDHDIHLRVQRAAEAVARKRGWKTAMDVRTKNIQHVAAICENVLRSMPVWLWSDYVTRIEQTGNGKLKVMARTDSHGAVKGYAIVDDDAKYKASELGRGFTYSRLSTTWLRLHQSSEDETVQRPAGRWHKTPQPAPVQMPPRTAPFIADAKQKKKTPPRTVKAEPNKPDNEKTRTQSIPQPDYTNWTPNRSPVDIDVEGLAHHLYLPKNVLRHFDDIFDYREVENWKPLTNLACAYFAGLLSPDASMSAGGGGPTNDTGWRNKDEDDIEFARRCAQIAKQKIGIKKKTRGLHR